MVMRTPPQSGILKPEWPGSAQRRGKGLETAPHRPAPPPQAGDWGIWPPGSRDPCGSRQLREGWGEQSVLGMGK